MLALALLGAADEENLADAAASLCGFERLETQAPVVDARVFRRVPFEVAYRHGLAPIAELPNGSVEVLVVDPTELAGLASAEEAVAVPFVTKVCSVSVFADAFERAAGRPWKVAAHEIVGARGALGASSERLDADLQVLFSASSSGKMRVSLDALSAGQPSVEVELIDHADEDEPILELVPKRVADGRTVSASHLAASADGTLELDDDDVVSEEFVAAQRRRTEVAIELVDEGDIGEEPILELGGGQPESSVEMLELVDLVEQSPQEVPPLDPEAMESSITTIHGLDPGLLPIRAIRAEASKRARAEVTPAMALEAVVDDALAVASGATPRHSETPGRGARAVLQTANVERKKTAEPKASDTLERSGPRAGSMSVSSPVDTRHDRRSISISGEYEIPRTSSFSDARPVQTSGEFSGIAGEGAYVSVNELPSALGAASAATRAAFGLVEGALDSAGDRDAIARQLVETLGLAYPTVLLLSVRPPRLVVWDGVLATGSEGPLGADFPLQEGGVWHQVVSEQRVFVGTIPSSDPVRRRLPRALAGSVLVTPLQVRGRTVALLLLASAAGSDVDSPGGEIPAMARRVESAFRRVIVRRKNSSRSV